MMRRDLSFFKTFFPAILSGVMMGTSYIPLPPWALLFCYVPLWVSIHNDKSWKMVFLKAWITQVTLTLIGFHWIAYVSHEFGFFPWPVAILILGLFAAFVHLYIPASALLAWYLTKKLKLQTWAFFMLLSLFFSLSESLWPSLFPWNLAYSFLPWNLSIVQWTDTIGFLGLSFLVYLSNAFLSLQWIKISPTKNYGKILKPFSYVIIVFLILNFLGLYKKPSDNRFDKVLKVLQIQGNIGNLERLAAEQGDLFDREIAEKYFQLTRLALAQNPQTDLVVWPEAAFPDFLGNEQTFRVLPQTLRQFVQEIKKPLLTGAYDVDPSQAPPNQDPSKYKRKEYNSLFILNSKGENIGPSYRKTNLLAFGEYTPFADYFPFLAKISPAGSGFGKGPGPIAMPTPEYILGPQICYEGLYPDFSAKLSQQGAQIIVNLTNDSWFGKSFEPWQNMYMTLARALETRLPVIRSTNTGVTSAIQADGTLMPFSSLMHEWFGLFEIRYSAKPQITFYTKYGKFFPVVLALLVFATLFWGRKNDL